MKQTRLAARVAMLLVGLTLTWGNQTWAGTSPSLAGHLDPIGAARGKLAEAHRLLLTQSPLDLTRYCQLLAEAHKLAPALDRQTAAEWRRYAILKLGYERAGVPDCVNQAVTLDPSLAFDDTIRTICSLLFQMPPAVTKQIELRQAREKKAGKPSADKVVVVPYVPPPDNVLYPRYGATLGGTHVVSIDRDNWPRVLSRTPPEDPRPSGSPEATVTVKADLDMHGRLSNLSAVGPGELGSAAEQAVQQWSYRPLLVFGHPVVSSVDIIVRFPAKLGGDRHPSEASMPANSSAGSASNEGLPKFGEYVYVEELPEVIERVKPTYDASKGTTGTVLVQALVGGDGRVKDTRVTKSVADLDEAAVAAVQKWRFKPAFAAGKPVAVWVAVPIVFPPK